MRVFGGLGVLGSEERSFGRVMSRRRLKYRGDSDLNEENQANGERNRGIRGPNSALTEFLRQQGINAEEIRLRHERRLREGSEGVAGEAGSEPAGEQNEQNEQNDEDDEQEAREEQEVRTAARLKRQMADRANFSDSDEEEIGTSERKHKIVGDEDTCAHCYAQFKVTLNTKKSSKVANGNLCADCTKIEIEKERLTKRNQLLSRKKRQKLAQALLNREDVKLPSLQDLAILKISDNIQYVESFGDIGSVNMKKIAKILCRNRSLNDRTLQLFLSTSIQRLEFWDCSGLTKDGFDQIVSFCPNLKELKLLMCGRFHNDNLNLISSNLKHLQHFEIDGPFLINDSAWQNFFKSIGKNLKTFKISNTHRFLDQTLQSLLENCGESLEHLKLSRLDGIKDKASYDSMPIYLTNLKSLEISFPHHEDLVDDSQIINLLGINGETLTTLVLDGCSGLTDNFLINGLKPFAINLRKLSLMFLDQITSEGFVGLFHEWQQNYGLNEVYLTKCFSLGDEGIIEMLLHSNQSLVELSINSIKDLTVSTFQIMKCPNLTYLDVGFVRSCDDIVLELLGESCPQLKVIDCYGDNRCTSQAKIRPGLKVIGRQSDTI